MDYDEQALFDGLMEEVSKNTLYARLGGKETFMKISHVFYEKLFAIAPTIPSWKVMFIDRGVPKERLAQDQYEFLMQRFGGPSDYSARKGWPAMKLRHCQFEIKPSDNQMWLKIMQETLDEVLGDKFVKEKNEMMKGLIEQGSDLVTTEEDGTRIYGPMDRLSYLKNIEELKHSWELNKK